MSKYSILTFILAIALSASGRAEIVERIAAVVNDKVITMSDMEEETAIRRQMGTVADKAAVLDSMIERYIVSVEANRLGITVTMDEVGREIVSFENTFPSGEEFKRFLETYEMSIQDLSKRFASSIAVLKVRQQKDAVTAGRYEKWLDEAKKKAEIRILE